MLKSIIIISTALLAYFVVIIISFYNEKRRWNNGKCKCGGNLIIFDIDSQGCRGYECNRCGKCVWISYHIDKIRE